MRYTISLLVNHIGIPNFAHSTAACCVPTMRVEIT